MNNLTFSVESKNIKIKEINKGSFLELEMYCISDQNPNRNFCAFTKESMIQSIPTIYNKPVLGYFSPITKEFEEHNLEIKFDPETGKLYENFEGRDSEKAIGLIRESDSVDIVEHEGQNWIKLTCGIWNKYNRNQVINLVKSKRKKVSVEVSVLSSHQVDGIEIIDEFIFNGVTILGNVRGGFVPVVEGIPGAHLRLLEFINSERFNNSMRALSFAAKAEKEGLDQEAVLKSLCLSDNLKHYPEEIYFDGYLLLQDYSDGKLFVVQYDIIDEKIVIDYEPIKIIDSKEMSYADKLFIGKDSIGNGEEVAIDFSKESVSDDPWGLISKTDLRNKILSSSNYKQLVGKAYLVAIQGWEDSPSSSLKYPVAQIKDGKLVFNSEALNVADVFLKRNKDEPYYKSALKKLNSLKRMIGMEITKVAKDVTEEKNVMKNKFINVPVEFKHIHSDGNKAFFVKDGKIFSLKVLVLEDESEEKEIEFNTDELKAVNLFAKEDEELGDEEEIRMTEVIMSFVKEKEDALMAMEQEFADKAKEISDKEEEFATIKAGAEKMSAENEELKSALKLSEKNVLISQIKEMAFKEELLSDKDRSELYDMVEKNQIVDLASCEREIAMRVYASFKRAPLSFKIVPTPEDDKDETALEKASRLINKKK